MSSEPLMPVPRLKPVSSISSFHGRPRLADRLGKCVTAVWLVGPVVIGTSIGSFVPTKGEPCSGLPPAIERLSAIIGWTYFAAWSISFYPQVWLNFRRRSVVGLSLDFQILNMVGFMCYAIYNSALYWNPVVRRQYADAHGGTVPAVHANDVFFAIHAAALTGVTLLQCCLLDRGGQRPSRLSVLVSQAVVAVGGVYAGAVLLGGGSAAGAGCAELCLGCRGAPGWWALLHCGQLSWLSWLYFLSFVKLAISLVKYIPQVVLNYRRQSTQGWNIWNVLLDFEGGALSLTQLLMDSGVTKDWSPVTGNPVKFGLGFASMVFDAIFMVQHYLLYPDTPPPLPQEPPVAQHQVEAGCPSCGEGVCSCPAAPPLAPGQQSGSSYDAMDDSPRGVDDSAQEAQQGEHGEMDPEAPLLERWSVANGGGNGGGAYH